MKKQDQNVELRPNKEQNTDQQPKALLSSQVDGSTFFLPKNVYGSTV